MTIGTRILIFNNIPFAYALIGIIVLFQDFTTFEVKLTAIVFFGGLLSAVLIIIEPVERLVGFFIIRHFRKQSVTNLPGITLKTRGGVIKIIGPNTVFGLKPITSQIWKSKVVSYLKNRITSLVYTLIFFSVVAYYLFSENAIILNYFKIGEFEVKILAGLIIVVLFLIILVLARELRCLPIHVRVADIYLMKVEGTLPAGNNFKNLETAIQLNDWVTARYWARRSHLEGDFNPTV